MAFYRGRAEFPLSKCDGAPWRGIQRSLRHPIGDRTVSDHTSISIDHWCIFTVEKRTNVWRQERT